MSQIDRTFDMNNWIQTVARGTERTLCVINGIFGDTLEKNKMGLQMALYVGDEPVRLTTQVLEEMKHSPTGKICILAHGNCGSHQGWKFKGENPLTYGTLLQQDFGFDPYFLRYNSGLHVSTNGKTLSNLIDQLIASHPQKINEILLVGHSMGGLVFRSACHYGQKGKREWVGLVKKVFYLGSPHLGTHVEKIGKITTSILKQIPSPITKGIATVGNWRSAGIKDLRHGFLTDEEWQMKEADDLFYLHQKRIPLLKGTDHYLICGTISKVKNSKMGRLFGDGMVSPSSAMGQGFFSDDIPFLKKHCKIIPGVSHNQLLKSKKVYSQIKKFIPQTPKK